MSLLILPLYIPVLIFGAGAVYASSVGLDITGHFSLLGALLILALAFVPWVSANAVKIAIE
jgi:heme exporter protein B